MPTIRPRGPGGPPSDEDLVRAARSGDDAALQTLFDRHVEALRARVRARLSHLVRRRVGASDIIQEAYLTAHRRLAEFEDRGEGSFGRWLTQIVDHKIHDEARKHVGTQRRSVRREMEAPPSGASWTEPRDIHPSPSDAVMAKESREEIEAVLAGLSDTNRTLLRMVHGKGLALAEVARLLGKSPEAIRQAYARAIAAYTAHVAERRSPSPTPTSRLRRDQRPRRDGPGRGS